MILGKVLLKIMRVCLSLGDKRILRASVEKESQENGLLII